MIKISLQPEGPAGVSVLEPPVPKPSDADVSPPLTKPLGTDLQPLELRGRDVVTADGAPVLRCLDHRATVRVQEDGSLVIGVASPSGATPMLDVALGQVGTRNPYTKSNNTDL